MTHAVAKQTELIESVNCIRPSSHRAGSISNHALLISVAHTTATTSPYPPELNTSVAMPTANPPMLIERASIGKRRSHAPNNTGS